MAVTFDATTSATGANVTSLSWTHTTAGADRHLAVGSAIRNQDDITSVTYAGVNLSRVAVAAFGGFDGTAEAWRLIAPALGANTVTITLPAAHNIAAGAASYNGSHQTTQDGAGATANGSSTAPSVTVSSAVDEVVFCAVGSAVSSGNETSTPGAGQTERWDLQGNFAAMSTASDEAGAASVVMNHTFTESMSWGTIGYSIRAAAAGGATWPGWVQSRGGWW